MATIELEGVWIHDAFSLLDFITFAGQALPLTAATSTEVRERAGGRLRRVSRPTRRQRMAVSGFTESKAVVDQLVDWAGETLMLRDAFGRKLFGIYAEITVSPLEARAGWQLSFTFQQISYSEAV